MGKLVGHVAIVTGAGQGIGRGIAVVFAKEGAKVAIVDRTAETCKEVTEYIRSLGHEAIAIICDVGDSTQVEAMVKEVGDEYGSIDILVNNAQRYVPRRLVEEIEDEDWDKSIQVGLKSTWYCCKAVFPYMKEKGGKIINMCSGAGLIGLEGRAVYCATKEAVRAFSKTAAREWGKYKIHVNVICPAAITPATMFMKNADPEEYARTVEGAALGRWGDPENDIGRVAVFLASSDSDYMTGQTLAVDGGNIML
jgi:NAD(P)-dependent dehydrogenase (short-subunit alcohol dehydrogenase family)